MSIGCTHIAFVGGSEGSPHELQPVALRRIGVRRAVAEAGSQVRLTEIDTSSLNAPSGAAVGRELAQQPVSERPDGILAVTDLLAMAIINELTAAHIRVPADIAVMGCDHNSAAWGGAVPLTSVAMEGERMGAEGVRLLLQELEDGPREHVHQRVVLAPSLVIRESTVGRPE